MAGKRHRGTTGRDLYRERMRVLRRHARRVNDTVLAHCVPTEAEIQRGFEMHGRVGKVIYDTRARAANAATELRRLGFLPQTPYECPRAADGHWHLRKRLEV